MLKQGNCHVYNSLIKAVDENRVSWIPEETSVFAESCGGTFTFLGSRFHIEEWSEEVISLNVTER